MVGVRDAEIFLQRGDERRRDTGRLARQTGRPLDGDDATRHRHPLDRNGLERPRGDRHEVDRQRRCCLEHDLLLPARDLLALDRRVADRQVRLGHHQGHPERDLEFRLVPAGEGAPGVGGLELGEGVPVIVHLQAVEPGRLRVEVGREVDVQRIGARLEEVLRRHSDLVVFRRVLDGDLAVLSLQRHPVDRDVTGVKCERARPVAPGQIDVHRALVGRARRIDHQPDGFERRDDRALEACARGRRRRMRDSAREGHRDDRNDEDPRIALAAASVVVPSGLTRARQHLIYDLIAFLAGGGLIVFGFIVLRRKRLLENVPTSRIRSVAMGFAELAGRAKNRTPLAAPFSDIPCVYYRFLVEEERQGRRGREWTTIDKGQSSDPFYLQDETGALLVDPSGAETGLERSFRRVECGEGWFGRRKRVSEWWIVPGQKLFVAGTVRRLRDAVLERRVALGDRLRALKHDAEKMKTFDADHDGQIGTEEWGNAVRAVQDELVREEAKAPQEPPEESIAIGKGTDEKTFVIAERGERSLLIRLGLTAAGALLGGTAAVVVFLVSLLARSGVMGGGWVFPW